MSVDRAAWLEARRSGIGGSDVAAVLGVSPWTSPLQLYLDKIGEAPPERETDQQLWGVLLEDVVAREYARRHGVTVQPGPQMLRHPDYPWAFANVDRVVDGGRRGVEVKTTFWFAAGWGEPGTDEMPQHVVAQVAWYAGITGIEEWDVPVLIGGSDLRVYRYRRDPGLEAMLLDVCGRWWREHVEARVPPAPRSSAEAALRWPRDTGDQVYASADVELTARALARVKAEIKRLEAERDGYELALKAELGDASVLVGADGRPLATWKASTSRRVDVTRMQQERPEVCDLYRVESSTRRFLLKVKESS